MRAFLHRCGPEWDAPQTLERNQENRATLIAHQRHSRIQRKQQTRPEFLEVLNLRCRAHCTSCNCLNQQVIRSPHCIVERSHNVNQLVPV